MFNKFLIRTIIFTLVLSAPIGKANTHDGQVFNFNEVVILNSGQLEPNFWSHELVLNQLFTVNDSLSFNFVFNDSERILVSDREQNIELVLLSISNDSGLGATIFTVKLTCLQPEVISQSPLSLAIHLLRVLEDLQPLQTIRGSVL